MKKPICYYIGRWGERWGKNNTFCFVAQTSTLKLAQAVAAITQREILSDDDPRAEDCDWVWDYNDSITDVVVHEEGEDGESPGQGDGSGRGGGGGIPALNADIGKIADLFSERINQKGLFQSASSDTHVKRSLK